MQRTVRTLLAAKPPGLYTVDAEDPVRTAIQFMADHHVGALPVMRGPELAGIVSERDYARKVVLMGRNSTETPVWQIMSSPVVTVGPGNSVEHCMRLMTDRRIRHLPVVQDGALVGMISIGDCVRALLEEQREEIDELKRYIAS
jgi:CBS domain-containing protein